MPETLTQQKKENRKSLPVTASIVDDFRAAGFDVKVLSTTEKKVNVKNGH